MAPMVIEGKEADLWSSLAALENRGEEEAELEEESFRQGLINRHFVHVMEKDEQQVSPQQGSKCLAMLLPAPTHLPCSGPYQLRTGSV